MPEPGNDFDHWIVSSSVPPDKRDPEALCDGIAAALKSRDLEAVVALLTVLALADPQKAQVVYDMMTAALDGDIDRAVLLAVLGG
jgi:hypothetical protein